MFVYWSKMSCARSQMGASQVALVVKNVAAMQESQETRVRSLGREDPLK